MYVVFMKTTSNIMCILNYMYVVKCRFGCAELMDSLVIKTLKKYLSLGTAGIHIKSINKFFFFFLFKVEMSAK